MQVLSASQLLILRALAEAVLVRTVRRVVSFGPHRRQPWGPRHGGCPYSGCATPLLRCMTGRSSLPGATALVIWAAADKHRIGRSYYIPGARPTFVFLQAGTWRPIL